MRYLEKLERKIENEGPTLKNLVEGDVDGFKEDARNPLFFANSTLQSQPGAQGATTTVSQVQLVFCPLVCAGGILGETVRWGKFEKIFTG